MRALVSRTFIFGIVSLVMLLWGYWLSLRYAAPGMALFAVFAAAVVGALGVVAGRNLGGDAVKGDGLGAYARRLLTSEKPPEPKP